MYLDNFNVLILVVTIYKLNPFYELLMTHCNINNNKKLVNVADQILVVMLSFSTSNQIVRKFLDKILLILLHSNVLFRDMCL